jgi:probable F420-dependent oxidoreductase
MRFGLALPHYDFSAPDGRPATVERILEHAVAAERAGYDSVWISDHLFLDLGRYGGPAHRYGTPEALSTLAAMARETSRVRLGTLVLGVAFRHPVVLAKEAATIHEASGGRFELGLGAGWYEDEYRALGIPFGSPGERIGLLDEAMQILDGLFAGERVTFAGRCFDIRDATLQPRPAKRPATWIGSKGGPRMLRLVAERADGWNVVWRMRPDAYRERIAALERVCERAGRDPSTVRRSIGLLCVVGEDEADLDARWRRVQAWAPGRLLDGAGPETLERDALAGTPDRVAERVSSFAELGVEEIILSFAPVPFAVADADMPGLFAERVAPLVR